MALVRWSLLLALSVFSLSVSALVVPAHAEDAPASKPLPCSAPAFHQWDFWLGSWRVTDPKGVFQGTNEIKVAPSGCGLIENWAGAEGGQGTSFNGYDAIRKTWTQLWLSPGTVIRLEGRLDKQGAMRMAGTISYNARAIEHPFRGIWTKLADGAVKQEFYEYDPQKKTWGEWFTGIYRHPDAPCGERGCAAPQSRQFDFWVGKWDVFDRKSGERAGTSMIEKLYGACAIRENWSEPGFSGGSLNVFSNADGQWHQFWVDQAGAMREFVGGIADGAMVLVAKTRSPSEPRADVLVRMIFTANPDHTVRQHSEYSKDGGKNWLERYDYIYRPALER